MTAVIPIRYDWKPGSRISADAQAAGKQLEQIAKRDGDVAPTAVVEENRPASAPLHNEFEWNDTAAATAYREDQARKIIRSIVVVHVRSDTEEELPPVRALVKVAEEPLDLYEAPRHYTPIAQVMNDSDLRSRYVRQAFKSLVEWRDRYQDIEEFARIFQEVDTLRQQYQ